MPPNQNNEPSSNNLNPQNNIPSQNVSSEATPVNQTPPPQQNQKPYNPPPVYNMPIRQTPPVNQSTTMRFSKQDSVVLGGEKPVNTNNKKKKNFLLSLNMLIIVLVVLVLSGVGYAYVNKLAFFSKPPYTEDNLISGLLSKLPEIKSASYSMKFEFYTVERDIGAEPFQVVENNDLELKEKYSRDYRRSNDIRNILSVINYYGYNNTNYPNDLSKIKSSKNNIYGDNFSIIDPLTKKQYKYSVTDGGKNFELSIDFETTQAINEIRSNNQYSEDESKVIISGLTAKFNKDTVSYFYLSSRPPKTFFESLEELSMMVPPDLSIDGAISGQSNWGENKGPIDWLFNISGTGDFGDLSYKVDIDLNRKDKNYYARVNNFPSFFYFNQIPKKEWIKLNSDKTDTEDENFGYSLMPDITEFEEDLEKSKSELIKFIRNIAKIADEENLYSFKEKPVSEKIDGKLLYRYEMKIQKEAIISFYRKIIEESMKDEYNSIEEFTYEFSSPEYLSFLESKEFNEIYDYLDENSSTLVWVDSRGFPAIYESTLRIVPPNSIEILKDKQIMIRFKAELKDINEPVEVKEPESFKTIDEVFKSTETELKAKSAQIKAKLSNLRAEAELFADDSGGVYGSKPFALGVCTNTAGTLFADEEIYSQIKEIKDLGSEVMCVSSSVGGKVTSYAISATLPDDVGYSFCVDNISTSGEIFGKLNGKSCSSLE